MIDRIRSALVGVDPNSVAIHVSEAGLRSIRDDTDTPPAESADQWTPVRIGGARVIVRNDVSDGGFRIVPSDVVSP